MNEQFDDDEDFQPSQWRNGQWSQYGSSQRTRTARNSQMSQPQPNIRQGQISQRRQSSQQSQQISSQQSQPVTSTINNTNNAAQDLLVTLIQSAVAGKLPAKEKKPKVNERERLPCLLCASTLATQTTLFRHYKTQHDIPNPAQFLGYKETTVFNLDTTMEEFQCNVCGLVVPNGHALDVHSKTAHNNDANNNSKQRCNECGFEANNRHQLDVHSRIHASSSFAVNNNVNTVNSTLAVTNNTAVTNTNNPSTNNANSNKNNANKTILDSMHKCDKCVCYFEEKRKLDEHMKDVHGREVVCNICNTYLPYEDYENHFRNHHPEVYNTKNKVVHKKEKTFVRKFFRTRSGKIVAVFKCVKCNDAFDDESKATRHVKLHKRVKTAVTVESDTENRDANNVGNENSHDDSDKDILYTCGACDTSTASYDVVVEHSQSHLTDPNRRFVTKTCEICDLKFEQMCYEQHVTRHCINENLRKESFTRLQYDHNLLLSKDWSRFFNMAEEEWRRIVSKSIYEHTRSVKMRALSGETSSLPLFQCGKCKRFVAPSSVANHTRIYDTCLRIKKDFPCPVCERPFNDRSTLNDHVKLHDDDKDFRVVVFNTDVDKRFNELLTEASKSIACESSPPTETNNVTNVLFKCLCSLCFVSKETADEHVKVCPGKEPRQNCQKCNYIFGHAEIITHYLRHHTNNESNFLIKNITPDVIEIESDNEPELNDHEVIDLSDDERVPQMNTAAERTPNTGLEAMVVSNSNNEAHDQDGRNLETRETHRDIKTENQLIDNGYELPNYDSEEAMSIGSNDDIRELTDTDSRDTIIDGECDEILEDSTKPESKVNSHRLASKRELKCVPTSALIDPLRRGLKTITTEREINEEDDKISSIKEEKSWDDTESQCTRISGRPSLRSVVTSTYSAIPVYEIITDDEDQPISNEAMLNASPRNITSSDDIYTKETPEPSECNSNVDIDECINTLAREFHEDKENASLNIRDNDIVAIDSAENRELQELNKIKQRLIALSANNMANEHNEVNKNGNESVIKELSLRAVFEKTHVSEQNVRIDIEYNAISNNRSYANSAMNSSDHAAIEKRNSHRTHTEGYALGFNEKLTSNNNIAVVKQGKIPKEENKAVVNTNHFFRTINTAQHDNIESIITSPVVRRGKISMRMLKRGRMDRNDNNNCCLS